MAVHCIRRLLCAGSYFFLNKDAKTTLQPSPTACTPVIQVQQVLEVAQHVAPVLGVLAQRVASHVEQLEVGEAHQVRRGSQLRQAVFACRTGPMQL